MMPEPGRQAAHVFLDAVSAWDDDATDQANEAAATLAFDRLNESVRWRRPSTMRPTSSRCAMMDSAEARW